MLRHVCSGQLLYLDTETASDDITTWRVSVGKADSPACCTLIRFQPFNSTAKEGALINYSASVCISFLHDRSELYLSLTSQTMILNAAPTPHIFTLTPYMDGIEQNLDCMRFRLPITILHTKVSEYLCHDVSQLRVYFSKAKSFEAYWIFECDDPRVSTVLYGLQVRIKHAFSPFYLTWDGKLSAEKSPDKDVFTLSWDEDKQFENPGRTYLLTAMGCRLGLSNSKMDSHLLSNFLPFDSVADNEEFPCVEQLMPTSVASQFIFEMTYISEVSMKTYMQVEVITAQFEFFKALVGSTSPIDFHDFHREINRALRVYQTYIQPRLHEQSFTDQLIAFQYHETIFKIVYDCANPSTVVSQFKYELSSETLQLWLTAMRVLVKKHSLVAEFVSRRSDEVKELVKWNHIEAGKLYNSMIKVTKTLPGGAETFYQHWSSELADVTEANAHAQKMYLQILTSACNSQAGEAGKVKLLVEQLLKKRSLIQMSDSQDETRVSLGSYIVNQKLDSLSRPLSEYLGQVLLLYSSLSTNLSMVLSSAKLTSDVLKKAIGDPNNISEVRKAFSLLRSNMLISPEAKFLRMKDDNFLYSTSSLTESHSSSMKFLPWAIGESLAIDSISEDIWRAVTETDPRKVTNTNPGDKDSDEIDYLLVMLSQIRSMLNECRVTDLFLRVLKVAVASMLWGFVGKEPEGGATLGVCRLVLDISEKRDGKTQTQMGQLFQETIAVYSMISKIDVHRKVDELVVEIHKSNNEYLSSIGSTGIPSSDKYPDLSKKIISEYRKSQSINEFEQWKLWAEAQLREGVEDAGESHSFRKIQEIEERLAAIREFDKNWNLNEVPLSFPDALVVWSLLTSKHIHSMSATTKHSAELLLIRLLSPKHTLHQCIEKVVIVNSFKAMTIELQRTMKILEDPIVRQQFTAGDTREFEKAIIVVCNLLLSRIGSSEFRKMQAIMRNMKLHLALAPYIVHLSKKKKDDHTRKLRILCATFMFRFVSQSRLNRNALLEGLSEPVQFWEAPQFISFVQETVDFSEISLNIIHRFLEKVLSDLLQDRSANREFCPYALLRIPFESNKEPNQERQNILCRLVLRREIKETDSVQKRKMMFRCLTSCCKNNPAVVQQCRNLFSAEKLANMARKEFSMEILKEYVDFFHYAYLQKLSNDTPPTQDIDSTISLLSTAWSRALPFAQDFTHFEELCTEGRYSVVRCYFNAYKREISSSEPHSDSYLAAWNLISSGRNEQYEGGLLCCISSATMIFSYKFERKLLRLFEEGIVYDLQHLHASVNQFSNTFDNFELLKRLENTLEIVKAALGYPDSLYLHKIIETEESSYQTSMRILRSSSSDENFPNELEIQMDETYDQYVSSFAQAFKRAFKVKTEVSESLHQCWKSSFSKRSSKINTFVAGAKSLLYESRRDMFFSVLTNAIQIEIQTAKGQSKMSDIFNLVRNLGLFNDAVETILKGKSMKDQSCALKFINEIIEDQSHEDLGLLKQDLEKKEYIDELFIMFYTEISTLCDTINSQKFNVMVHSRAKLKPHFMEKETIFVTEMCRFIRNVCDNLNTEWQDFFRDQQSLTSIDIVSEVAGFVAAFGRYPNLCVMSPEGRQVMMEGLGALVELASGSGNENQAVLLQTISLYPALNSIIENVLSSIESMWETSEKLEKDEPEERLEIVNLFGEVCQLLIALTETERQEIFRETLMEFLRFDMIGDQLFSLYTNVLEKYTESLSLGEAPESIKNLTANAIYLRIVLVKLCAVTWTPEPLLWITGVLVPIEKARASAFYEKYTGSVEINDNNGKLQMIYFPIPFKTFFLTGDTFTQIIIDNAELPHEEKLEAFVKQHVQCHDEMRHQQQLASNPYLKSITGHWKIYGHISIIMLLIINCFMVFEFKEDEILGRVDEKRKWVKEWMRFLGFVQFIMGVSSYVCNFYEYIPAYTQSYDELKQKFSFEDFCKQEDNASLLQYETLRQQAKEKKKSTTQALTLWQLILVCLQPRSFYFLFYLLFSLFGFIWYICYSILLLDTIRRFESLTRLLRAITSTWQQLIITLAFETIIVFIFSTLGFLSFAAYYSDDSGVLVCSSLLNCFLSTIKTGLTQGGIGGSLQPADITVDYWSRMAFDMLFWSLAIVIMLNITFGIIIDSYSGLREEYRHTLEQLANNCFICGDERSNIESHGEVWEKHIYGVHYAKKYINFLVYLEEKPDKDCSGTEKAVKNKFSHYDVSFFPTSKKVNDTDD